MSQGEKKISSDIIVTKSNDPRSYRQNSDKLIATGFKQNYSVENAIDEIIAAFRNGTLRDEPHFHNLNWMNKITSDQREVAK